MPNHVTTRCTVIGPDADIAEFKQRMIVTAADERGKPYTHLDFDRIIPMPAVAHAVEQTGISPDVLALLAGGSGMVEVWRRLQHFDREGHLGPWKGLFGFAKGEIEQRLEFAFPGCIANARAMARCIGETGHKSWYEWSVANWGTKWNSYSFAEISPNPLTVKFETAWDFPTPVFEALARTFPQLQFDCVSFDEGWNFAARGSFNPQGDAPPWAKCKATDELYELVYGKKHEHDSDDAEDVA